DLIDDRRLAEPRQESPTSPRARQALTRPKQPFLRCLPFRLVSFSGSSAPRRMVVRAMRSAKGAPPRRQTRGNAHPLSRRRQARADLSDDRRLAEPRQETPTSPRARQALTRPKQPFLRCLPSSRSPGRLRRAGWWSARRARRRERRRGGKRERMPNPLSGRRKAREDLSDGRRLAEPRQQTPTRPRARQALTRPKETFLRCLPLLCSGGRYV